MLTYFDGIWLDSSAQAERLNTTKRLVSGLLAAVAAWRVRRATRGMLAELDEHGLKDIGVSRHEARVESSKPFWRA